MKRIGIFGGSFNPIHRGHVRLALSLCEAGVVDNVWFMVSPLNPFKQQGKNADLLANNYEDRLAMARLAVREHPQLSVSDFERHLPIPSYTWSTLQALWKAYPHDTFVLMIGRDNWDKFNQWSHASDLLRSVDVVIYDRRINGPSVAASSGVMMWNHAEQKLEDISSAYPFRLFEVSSTEVRQAFRDKRQAFLDEWLSPDVQDYCRLHALYR